MIKCRLPRFVRHGRALLAGLAILVAGPGAWAATTAINGATLAPPAGITDSSGGCDAAVPPTCRGNNAATARVDVWAVNASKRASPASGSAVLTGSTITYTLSVDVTGAATTAPVTLTDTLGAGLAYGSLAANPGGFTVSQAGSQITFTLPAGAAVGAHTVSYTAQVAANAVGSVGNSIVGANCGVAAPCATTHTVGSVSLSKELTREDGKVRLVAEEGELLTYSLTLTNPSGAAVAYNLTDILGPGLTYVGATLAPSARAGQTLSWNNLSVPANRQPLVIDVQARVDSPLVVAEVRNLARRTEDNDPTCRVGSCVVTPTAATVTMAKRANPASGATVVPGQSIDYTVTVTVAGGRTTADTVLRDTLGSGLTFVSASSGDLTATNNGNQLTFTLPAGKSAGTYTVTYRAVVNPGAANGSVNNQVVGATCATTGGCATNHPVGEVRVSKALSEESINRNGIAEFGELLTYTITLTNPTGVQVPSFRLTDVLGPGLTYESSTPQGSNAGATTTWDLPVPAGGATVTIKARVQSPPPDSNVRNVAKPSGGTDPVCPHPACVQTPVESRVTISKASNPARGATVVVGQTIVYTLTANIAGGATTTPTTLTDTLGGGLRFKSIVTPPGAGSFTAAAGASANVRTFTLPVGTAAGSYTVRYEAEVLAGANSGSVNNVVTGPPCVSAGECATTHTVGSVSLSKELTREDGKVRLVAEEGELLTYSLTLTNPSGAAVAYNLTDILGPGLTYVGATLAPSARAGQTLSWNNLSVPANRQPLVIDVQARVDSPLTVASIRNIAKAPEGPIPPCPSDACVETPTAPRLTLAKRLASESGKQSGIAEANETLVYDITVANAGGVAARYDLSDVLGVGLSFVSATDGGVNDGRTTRWPQLDVPAQGSRTVSLTARVDSAITTTSVTNLAKPTGGSDPQCPGAACVETPTEPRVAVVKRLVGESGRQAGVAEAGETLNYAITFTNTGGSPFNGFRFVENVPAGATLRSVSGASGFGGPVVGPASVSLQVPAVPAAGSVVVGVVFEVAQPVPAGVTTLLNLVNGPDVDPACGANCSVTIPVEEPSQLSVVKIAGSREAKVGDLVRYTVTVTNIGPSNVVGAKLIDTPPPGFSYVADSIVVNDVDGAFVLGASRYPLEVGGIDVPMGKQATVSYLLRVGAGVLRGPQINRAQATDRNGRPNSNLATAQVEVVADPLVDESLILGTVFDDRNGDGWQAPASLTGVRVQGGFAPSAYIAGSTMLRRDDDWTSLPDASAPLLHGIDLGRLAGRQSEADPPERQQLVLRQRLREPSFTDDFVLTSDQGLTLRLDAAGRTRLEKADGSDAAKGLNGGAPTVERRVGTEDGAYVVDYLIRNQGIDERGVPGVRIASVEGLLIETDAFGRYNLAGIDSGNAHRGRNFILKVDPSTLPDGAELTTPNPLVRRITPGLPARFDFGVRMPAKPIEGAREQVDIVLGEVLFAPGSAELAAAYAPTMDKIAARVESYGGGELVVRADGESEALALDRVQSVEAALRNRLSPGAAKATRVSARLSLNEPATTVVGVQGGDVLLGTVLFDTDKSVVKPRFRALLRQLARRLEAQGGGTVALVGHADRRASDAYNLALGLRRARAVYEAIAQELKPEVRAKVRVETLNDAPAARAGGQ